MAVIRLTTGKPGDGKTWSIVRRTCKEWIPDKEVGTLWTNLPLKLDELSAFAQAKHGLTDDELRSKIRVIPQEEIDRWRRGSSNPAIYFQMIAEDEDCNPLDKSHVIIDEAGKIWPSNSRKTADEKRAIDAVAEWLATIRHEGATIELICQDSRQIDRKLVQMVGEHLVMNNTAEEKEPIGGCRKGDWYQLYSGLFLRESITWIRCTRSLPQGEKLEAVETSTAWLDPLWFKYYDSYNKPGAESGTRRKQPWERMNALALVGWFILNNLPNLAIRAAGVSFVAWLCFFGGGGWCVEYLNSQINLGMGKKTQATASQEPGRRDPNSPETATKNAPGRHLSLPTPADDPAAIAANFDKEQLVRQLRRVLEDLRIARDQAQKMQRQLDEQKLAIADASAVALITNNGFSFTNGDFYHVDEPISWGPYAGDVAMRVEPTRGLVRMRSGRVLRMQDAAPASLLPELAGAHQPARPPQGKPTPAAARVARDDGGEGDAGAGMGDGPRADHSVLDRSGIETR